MPSDHQPERLEKIKSEAEKLCDLIESEMIEGFESLEITMEFYTVLQALKKFIKKTKRRVCD